MYNFFDIFKNIFIVLYLLVLSYLILINESISLLYDIPNYIIPLLFFISIFFFLILYIKTYINSKKLEKEFRLIVNHNFRTPLTKILWFSAELKKEVTTNEKNQFSLNIENTTKKILDIVDLFVGIKDVNNKSGYFLKAQSLRDIIERSIGRYKEEINKRNISFKIADLNKIPLITVDLQRMSFVFDSIIENAIFYTGQKGNIEINAYFIKNKIILKVSDSGIGIGFFERRKIFAKFFRGKRAILTNPDGMGLKLYLSKKIIKRHNGKIYFDSFGKDKGSNFYIELPVK